MKIKVSVKDNQLLDVIRTMTSEDVARNIEDRYFRHGEYLDIEIDTDEETMTVLQKSR